jgi:putative intracellular protease/amidase
MGIGFRCEVRGEADTVTSRDGLKFSTQGRFDKIVQLDVIWVPGGNPGALAPMMNGKKPIHVNFLKAQSAKAHVIASVCEGALLLGGGRFARRIPCHHALELRPMPEEIS